MTPSPPRPWSPFALAALLLLFILCGGGAATTVRAQSLPAPWVGQDIGTTGAAGNATQASGTFSVNGAGADIYAGSDAFHYVYQPWTGDGEIVAKVEGFNAGADEWALAGVMFREDITAGSRHAAMLVAPSGRAKFRYRTAAAGTTESLGPGAGEITLPHWVKLTRRGSTFTGYRSKNGTDWIASWQATISMRENIHVGLAVTSSVAGTLATATLSTVATRLPSPWETKDIGSVGLAGSATYYGGAFTISGAGKEIYTSPDAFRYVYQPLKGDGQIVARVMNFPTGSNEWAMAGVMIRDTLDPASLYAATIMTPGGRVKFRRRKSSGATSLSDGPGVGAAATPYWVKLVRSGHIFTSYMSADGVSWTPVHTASDTVTMTNPVVYVGLIVASNNTAALCTSDIEGVAVEAPGNAPASPTGLVATTTSATQINLSWTDNSSNETAFKVERSTVGESTGFTEIASLAANQMSYASTGLSATTKYYYRVRATNAGGASAYSTEANATTSSSSPPPTPSPLVGHWKLDERTGTATADASGNGNTGNLSGATWTTGLGAAGALSFDGTDDRVVVAGTTALNNVTNNFTLAMWAYPRATHEVDAEAAAGASGLAGQRYAVGPTQGDAQYGAGHAGAGLSIGTNGVSVYEHASGYLPATLVHSAAITGWTHIALVYENRQPKLYINGVFVKAGQISAKSFVHINPADLGASPAYGHFNGLMDDVRIYNKVLTPGELDTLYNSYSSPYRGVPISVPGTVEVEDFDDGGQGIAYHDTTAGNSGNQYRLDTDVDVGGNTAGYNIGWTVAGEWTKYTIDVAATNTYTIEARASAPFPDSKISIEFDGDPTKTVSVTVPNTGAWGAWQMIPASGPVTLSKGLHVMRVIAEWPDGFLLDSIRLIPPVQSAPYRGVPLNAPGTIEIEDFDNGGQGVAYHDTTAGNSGNQYRLDTDVDVGGNTAGYNLQYTITGEWTKYTINVATADTYAVQARASAPFADSQMSIEFDGDPSKTITITVPNTGAWGEWQMLPNTGPVPTVTLSKGLHVMRFIVGRSGGFSLDSISLTPPAPSAPSSLSATAVSANRIDLSWTDNSTNETGFKIERKTGAGAYALVATAPGIAGTGNRTWSDTGLAANTAYTYRVSATNLGGDSAVSNVSSATTPPNPNQPPAVSITAPSNGAAFTAGDAVTISANASDSDGTVSKVDFYHGTTLVGTDTTGPSYSATWNASSAGSYALKAIATDNSGATTQSAIVNISVGLPTVSVTASDALASEAGQATGTFTLTRTGSTAAALTVNYGMSGSATASADYNALSGSVVIAAGQASAVLTVTPVDDSSVEGSEIVTLTLAAGGGYGVGSPSAATVTIADNDSNPPSVTITAPANNTSVAAGSSLTITANASDDGSVAKVEFFAGSTLLCPADTVAPYSCTWSGMLVGSYVITARATDNANQTMTSNVIINVTGSTQPGMKEYIYAGGRLLAIEETPGSAQGGDLVWVEDTVPAGAALNLVDIDQGGFDEAWSWVSTAPEPLSGTLAHQSVSNKTTLHQHYFYGAQAALQVNTGDKLFVYIYLERANMPSEVMLQWNDGQSWEHRAYWGADQITNLGANNTASRRFVGALPAGGQWVRLEVSASAVGLEGKTISGMAFTLYGGRATWDRAGKAR